MRKSLRGGIALCLTLAMLTGCSFGFGKNGSEDENQERTLKVMYYDENSFFQDYGMLYSALYPNIEIEVVNTNNIYNTIMEENDNDYEKALAAFIEKEQPDILMIDPTQLEKMGTEGKLYDIESFVTDGKYDVDGLIPGVIETMKGYGGGNLYAIPTNFSTQALFYNKDLFDEYNVPYPTDQMTWTEVINLASMFPTDGDPLDRVFGLKMGWGKDLNEMINLLANTEGLKVFDENTLQMTIDTPAWAAIVEQAQTLLKSDILFYDEMLWGGGEDGTVYFKQDESNYGMDPLLTGRLAMRVDGNYFVNNIEDMKNYAKNPEDFTDNWDLVTAPVGSQNPDVSYFMSYYNLFAINAASTNVEEAWNFIAYITGDEYARVKSKVSYGNLPLRTKYLNLDTERNYAAFYKLKPMNQNIDYTKIPERYQYEYYSIAYETFNKLNTGDITVAEALAELQLRGNELLATDKMTPEEQEKYWNEKNQGYMEGNVTSEELILKAAAGESVTVEEVPTPTEEAASDDVATEEVVE
ncbi:MAG: extracellular solute-binding protein [Candidatus Pristimantibacillus lignocellulolyticus]|uniref:Extracellular solute-binding protein n=1 Tax=Candidatus Pristimantibacillus lignocellulolyticus TaxID=2994561 RepID=A0A9J6ZKV2_9BACL|nr:MAG: extracellular solute-binding protein [Candidatus Pristimantibacillus lignocellulolyticus]